MIRKILELILLTILAILSYIIPKKKWLYIFGGHWWKSFSWNSKAFYLHLKNKEYKNIYYFLSNYKSLLNLKKILNNNVKFELVGTLKSLYLFLRAEYIFLDASPQNILPLKQLYIYFWNFKTMLLWHGDGFKKLENFKINTLQERFSFFLYKLYCKTILFWVTGNDFNKKIWSEAFLWVEFKKLWLPRYDIFTNKKLQIFINNIKEDLQLNKFSKLILYAPTWRDRNKFWEDKLISDKWLEKINNICKKNNCLFLIKPHPNQKLKLYKSFSNIKILISFPYDVEELLALTDILITDYSSIFVDFMIKNNNPILFYMPDYKHYFQIDKWKYLKQYINTLYPKNYLYFTEKDFIIWLSKLLSNKEIYQYQELSKLKRYLLQVHYNCCDNLYKIIKST